MDGWPIPEDQAGFMLKSCPDEAAGKAINTAKNGRILGFFNSIPKN